MTGLRNTVLTVVLGLVLGALVHAVAILAMPRLGTSSAYQRIAASSPVGATVLFDAEDGAVRPRFADPTVEMSACAFDLARGPFRVGIVTRDFVQSLSIHGEFGGVIYALSDRSATRGGINLTLMTRRQLEAAQAREEEPPPNELRVPLDRPRGLVVVRAHAPFESQREEARALVSSLSCQPQ